MQFDISGKVIVDKEGFYHGHTILQNVMLVKKEEFERVLCGSRSSTLSRIHEEIKADFFPNFERKYFKAQRSLANNFLNNKVVRVSHGISKVNVKIDGFPVRRIDASWPSCSPQEGCLLELSYGLYSPKRIWVTKNTTIQILGDI